jgi:ABC-type long-subunit fatty acid transport system fused permease/ATPase subunit
LSPDGKDLRRGLAPAGTHRWFWWSVVVSSIILFIVWFLVQLDVMINNWFGSFRESKSS